ncbi:MAG: signal peptidase [Propionibacteriaceae bacterium]|nr:signal peptidase [Propionibacteriaceae bacterium]
MSRADRSAQVSDDQPAPQRRLTFGQHTVAFLKELLFVVVGAIIVASLLRGFVGQMFIIPSSSMENTLLIGDRVVVEKLSSPKRGQVVVFADPGGWLNQSTALKRGPIGEALEFIGVLPDTATGHLIKRVIGLPGDEVACCDSQGRITVNQVPLEETSYLYTAPDGVQVKPSAIRFDVVVPAGRLFLMGDNRNNSRDSRCHLNDEQVGGVKGENAFVSEDLVVGRAFAVVWPLADRKRLTVPPTFANVAPGKSPAPTKPLMHAGPEANC